MSTNYPPSPYPNQYPPAPPSGFAPAPAPKRRRAGLWVALFVIVLLLAGGGAYYYFQIRSTPLKTLQTYCDGIKKSDAQEVYNTYSSDLQAHRSISQVQQEFQVIALFTGGIKDCSVASSSIEENSSTATGVITLISNRNRSLSGTVHLVNEK